MLDKSWCNPKWWLLRKSLGKYFLQLWVVYSTWIVLWGLDARYHPISFFDMAQFCSVVVITFASHAKGPRFEPGRKQSFFKLEQPHLDWQFLHEPALYLNSIWLHGLVIGIYNLDGPDWTSFTTFQDLGLGQVSAVICIFSTICVYTFPWYASFGCFLFTSHYCKTNTSRCLRISTFELLKISFILVRFKLYS